MPLASTARAGRACSTAPTQRPSGPASGPHLCRPQPAGVAAPPAGALQSRLGVRTRQLAGAPARRASTINTATTTSTPGAAEKVAAASAGSFDWHAHWWPVAALDSLPSDRPSQHYLLGQRLVVWRDDTGEWRAFADFCPHRGVPLSEGRVEEGGRSLACAYHGWRFDGEGSCVDVPQAIGPAAVAAATASPKACALPFPVAARPDGLLWVWPVARDFVRAAATPTGAPEVSELGEGTLWMAHWFVRDVAFGLAELMENVVDPVHVAFSHHGILGSRYAPPVQDFLPGEAEAVPETGGFKVRSVLRARARGPEGPFSPAPPPAPEAAPRTTIEFSPAGGKVHYSFGALGGSNMLTYSVPTAPGRARIFFSVLRRAEGAPRAMAAALRVAGLPLFRWKQHAGNNAVLSGDNVLCGAQTALLDSLAKQGKGHTDAYYTPTGADGAVLRLRGFFKGAPPIPWAPTAPPPPPPPDRRALLERLDSHTKICSHCSKALKVFTALRAIGLGGLAAAGVWGVAARAAGRALPPALFAWAALAGLAAAAAHKEVQELTFVDYIHQDKK